MEADYRIHDAIDKSRQKWLNQALEPMPADGAPRVKARGVTAVGMAYL
jgi:hypothetical protein